MDEIDTITTLVGVLETSWPLVIISSAIVLMVNVSGTIRSMVFILNTSSVLVVITITSVLLVANIETSECMVDIIITSCALVSLFCWRWPIDWPPVPLVGTLDTVHMLPFSILYTSVALVSIIFTINTGAESVEDAFHWQHLGSLAPS